MLCYKKKSGFTLIELMIVVAIIGILGAIAYPSYLDSIRKSRRSDGQDALTNAMQKQELFYANFSKYATSATDFTTAGIETDSAEKYYKLSIVTGVAGCSLPSCVSMQALPTTQNSQDQDKVSQYILTSTGFKQATYSGTDYPSWTNFN